MGVMLQKLNYSQKCFWPFYHPAGGGTSRRTSGQQLKSGSAKMPFLEGVGDKLYGPAGAKPFCHLWRGRAVDANRDFPGSRNAESSCSSVGAEWKPCCSPMKGIWYLM